MGIMEPAKLLILVIS